MLNQFGKVFLKSKNGVKRTYGGLFSAIQQAVEIFIGGSLVIDDFVNGTHSNWSLVRFSSIFVLDLFSLHPRKFIQIT